MTIQLHLTPEILKEIHYQRYNHPSPLVQRRMEAVWLKGHELEHGQIAELVGVTENTIRDYFELYQQGGIEKLKELKPGLFSLSMRLILYLRLLLVFSGR